VYHAHASSFWGFCRQHFEYGRGALRYHRVARARGSRTVPIAVKFHTDPRNWLLHPARWRLGQPRPVPAALLVLWQIANGFGFLWESLRARVGAKTP
jgi:hypothetical protein